MRFCHYSRQSLESASTPSLSCSASWWNWALPGVNVSPSLFRLAGHKIRDNAQLIAKAYGVAIEHINNSHLRKENRVSKVLAQRDDHPGLVPILSAMEACSAYEPWHDKQNHKTYLCSTSGKCRHYYFYFYGRRSGTLLLTFADLVSISLVILLQRPFPAGLWAHFSGHRFRHGI